MPAQQIILHPTDFSESSLYAFRLACSLAGNGKARLVVLYVPQPPPFVGASELARALEATHGYREELERRLRQLVPPDDSLPVEHLLGEGEPAEEIVRLARELPCDLIVMGTHGRTGLDRLLLGSVAEQVVRHAPCPVLTVKPPAAAYCMVGG